MTNAAAKPVDLVRRDMDAMNAEFDAYTEAFAARGCRTEDDFKQSRKLTALTRRSKQRIQAICELPGDLNEAQISEIRETLQALGEAFRCTTVRGADLEDVCASALARLCLADDNPK